MNKAKRKLIHEQLLAAVPFLAATHKEIHDIAPKNKFICHAIGHAAGVDLCNCDDLVAVKDVVMARLGKHDTVEQFLVHECGIRYCVLAGDNIQIYRHRWLQSLIKEFSK